MNRSEHAAEQFQTGLNCAQAVLAEFAEELGMRRDLGLRVASGFGGGIGRSGGVCGAVTGAVMVIGLMGGETDSHDAATKAYVQGLVESFLEEFVYRNGSTQCSALLGCDISTPQGYQEAASENLFATRCAKYVEDAVELIEDML